MFPRPMFTSTSRWVGVIRAEITTRFSSDADKTLAISSERLA